jgi:hypothetical protein
MNCPPESKLTIALALARMGFRVFPLEEDGKKPIYDGGCLAATTDEGRIRQWWVNFVSGEEQTWNIGIATGRWGGPGYLFVIDVDVKDGAVGDDSVAFLEDIYGELPKTPVSRTPTGGRHIFLTSESPVANSASKLAPNIDVRGVGGYVVAPGSTVTAGTYRWEQQP